MAAFASQGSQTKLLKFTNDSGQRLTRCNISKRGLELTFEANSTCDTDSYDTTLEAGDSCTVAVTYTPKSYEPSTPQVQLYCNDVLWAGEDSTTNIRPTFIIEGHGSNPSLTVNATATSSGVKSVSPTSAVQVISGQKAYYDVVAETGYTISQQVTGTCPAGTFNSGRYSTGAIVADCTVGFSAVLPQYEQSFNSLGGSPVASIIADFGTALTAPTSPTLAGYSFAGWTPALPATVPAKNATYTAQWTINSYSLTFDSAGGSAVAPISANFGADIAAPMSPTREGYTFADWSPEVPEKVPAANTTYTAQWAINRYSLSFDSAGGSEVAPISADFGAAITAPADPIREGYTFADWSPEVPEKVPAANTTYTAQWAINRYSLSFDSAGGSEVAPISADFGAAITAPADPIREGYTFTGWSPAMPATMPAQNLMLKAMYEQIELTVTASVSGDATISPASQQVNYGSAASIELTLADSDDIVSLSGSCEAALSGSQVITSAITESCDVVVTVHPSSTVEKDTDAILGSNGTSRFKFNGGAGDKSLGSVSVLRAGVESELAFEDATALLTLQEDGSYIFSASRTGRYTLYFVDTVSGEQIAVVYNVFPYLAFTASQQPVQQGVTTRVQVWLSDEPVEYPVTATVLTAGVTEEMERIELTAAHQLLRSYEVSAAATTAQLSLQDEGVTQALLGTPAVHQLAVQALPPALALTAAVHQNGVATSVVNQTDGLVVLSVGELSEAGVSYHWTSSDLALQAAGASASFDPLVVAEGSYNVTVTAESDDGRQGRYDLTLRVIVDCPVASCVGITSSGIPAAENNVAAMPNRLPICPNVPLDNRVGTCQVEGTEHLYAEVPNQYQLALGVLTGEQSWRSGQFGIALNDETLLDSDFVQHGVVLNFDVLGLASPGEAVPVAIPLPAATSIPADAVWRKYINGQWQEFVVDAANRIDSAARDALGQCPGVSSDSWTTGLTAGHGCVRLILEDGGPNDDDGVANGVIRDPGVLAVAKAVVPPTEPEPSEGVSVSSGGAVGGMFTGLLSLMVLWRRRMVLAAVLLPTMASANGLYTGVDAMAVHTDVSSTDVTAAMQGAWPTSTAQVSDELRTGFRAYAGYKVLPSVSFELAWVDLGRVNTQFGNIAPQGELSALGGGIPLSGEGVEGSVILQPWVYKDLITPGLRIGVLHLTSDNDFTTTSEHYRESDSDNVLVVEVFAGIKLTDRWQVKAGVSRYDTRPYLTYSAQVGLQYTF
ncbi:InlB B-repeat-containing protein [Shewanella algidipiscicola]|uniref:InlB B-repeat-containing protein n=1 Tax=Shewanella algidipiscicola TaxID=614070 RepID=UPI0013A5A857|nr:InlB B-repeat-containing protein [Shewanella algidipiscicola]